MADLVRKRKRFAAPHGQTVPDSNNQIQVAAESQANIEELARQNADLTASLAALRDQVNNLDTGGKRGKTVQEHVEDERAHQEIRSRIRRVEETGNQADAKNFILAWLAPNLADLPEDNRVQQDDLGLATETGVWYKRNLNNNGWELFSPDFSFGETPPLVTGTSASEGSSENVTRADHQHGYDMGETGDMVFLEGTTKGAGSSGEAADAGHQHAIGIAKSSQGGGTIVYNGFKGWMKIGAVWVSITHIT